MKLITLVTMFAVLLLSMTAQASGSIYINQIHHYQKETWKWQSLMGSRKTPAAHTAERSKSSTYRRWVRDLWLRRAYTSWKQALNPPHEAGFLCIHHFEGSWTDPNPPFYGGLQMDYQFQHTYGPELLARKGTADHWTPLEQIWVAERAHRSGRGYYPWPNTARYCGLI